MRRVALAVAVTCMAGAMPMQAAGGFGSFLGGGDVDKVIESGSRIILFSTIATDLAVSSAMQMLDAFPEEKVVEIRAKFIKYNELKDKRAKDQQLDSNGATLASDGFTEMAKLDAAGYNKAKAGVVRGAYTKLGLAVAADVAAATQLPIFITSGASAISSMTSNPLQLVKIGKLKTIVSTVTVLGKAIPSQMKSIKTVREIAKKIAEAENLTLGEPKTTVTSVDPKALAEDVKAVSKEAEG